MKLPHHRLLLPYSIFSSENLGDLATLEASMQVYKNVNASVTKPNRRPGKTQDCEENRESLASSHWVENPKG